MSTSDIGIVVAFHSPCDWSLPKRHLQVTLAALAEERCDVAVVQVVLPGQEPQPLPRVFRKKVLETTSVLFHKENLWNLGAELLPHRKICWVDADVLLTPAGWLGRLSDMLDEFNCVQPFSHGIWLDRDGRPTHVKAASASAVAQGLPQNLTTYHPGFSWAMRREAFEAIGGFFDLDPAGNGDTNFTLGLTSDKSTQRLIQYRSQFSSSIRSAAYRAWRRGVLSAGLSVAAMPSAVCSHLWHGDVDQRQYESRWQYFPTLDDVDSLFIRRHDGLLEWREPERWNQGAEEYFRSRGEDG